MRWQDFLTTVIAVFLLLLLFFYWIFPLDTINFTFAPKNSNFTITGNESMQFYPNLRYPSKDISYDIQSCNLQKTDDMKRAFDMVENLTVLNFYVADDEESADISITCDETTKFEGDLFVAGEGGPVNITKTEKFNVIHKGAVTLIRESRCENPTVETHELLHALGFAHSSNSNNIMYPVSKCGQTIGEDIPEAIDQLYSYPSLADLALENVSATMSGRYLSLNIIIRNQGLAGSKGGKIEVYADNSSVKTIDFAPVEIGYGRMITVTDIFIFQKNVEELRFLIKTDSEELDKENNEAILKYSN